jgi:hypothetical protein
MSGTCVLMRRSFRTRVFLPGGFPGFAPWAGMRCPVRAWDSKYGSKTRVDIEVERNRTGFKKRSVRRTYAAFLQNAGFFFRVDSQGLHPGLVCDAPLGHGIRNTVDGPGIGTADRSGNRKRGRGMGSGPRSGPDTGNVIGAWNRNRGQGPVLDTSSSHWP